MSARRTTDDTLRIVILVAAVLVLAPVLMMLVAFPMMGMWGGGWMMDGSTRFAPIWGFGLPLVWLAVLAVLGYLGYRWLSGREGGPDDPAIRELRIAYARGDLTDEEYEERWEKLGGE